MQRFILPICLGVLWLTGCSSNSDQKGIPKTKVSGTVLLDGKPMPEGEIRFTVKGEPVAELVIKDGNYSGEVHEGKNKVEIFRYTEDKSTDPPVKTNTLPEKWNLKSNLSVDVTSSTTEVPPFKVTSR